MPSSHYSLILCSCTQGVDLNQRWFAHSEANRGQTIPLSGDTVRHWYLLRSTLPIAQNTSINYSLFLKYSTIPSSSSRILHLVYWWHPEIRSRSGQIITWAVYGTATPYAPYMATSNLPDPWGPAAGSFPTCPIRKVHKSTSNQPQLTPQTQVSPSIFLTYTLALWSDVPFSSPQQQKQRRRRVYRGSVANSCRNGGRERLWRDVDNI